MTLTFLTVLSYIGIGVLLGYWAWGSTAAAGAELKSFVRMYKQVSDELVTKLEEQKKATEEWKNNAAYWRAPYEEVQPTHFNIPRQPQ